MVYIDNKFSGRLIVCGLNDNNIRQFMRNFIKNVWLEHKIPDGMRMVGSGTKLTLDMLPKNIDLNQIADRAVDKGILMMERIGGVNIWLNLWVTKSEGSNSQIKVDIDKYKYEKDGDVLLSVVNNSIKEL